MSKQLEVAVVSVIRAVGEVLRHGLCTADIAGPSREPGFTSDMGQPVLDAR